MTEQSAFFSVWAQDTSYWLVVEGPHATALSGFGPTHHKKDLMACKVGPNWCETWLAHAATLAKQAGGSTGHRAAVIAGEELPPLAEMVAALRPLADINAVAANLWLVESVQHGRLDCYMQRVLDRRGKQVGFEAFARIEAADGGVLGGGAIMKAAHTLRMEYQLDRLLHKQAIECFVGSDLEGYIFINFLTGFIHRPEVYFDGLSQAVTRMHVRPASVVLDVPLGDYARDMAKLKSIASYCRARGFALALDDVITSDGLAALLAEVRPAFVKLDGVFGAGMSLTRMQGTLHEIVRICHASGVSVLAEGVENEQQHTLYMASQVDMFQGYLFGAPERFSRHDQEHARAASAP